MFEPQGFLVLSICLIFTLLITYKTISKKLKSLGTQKEDFENKLVKIIQNGIGSIKITKLFNLERKNMKINSIQ